MKGADTQSKLEKLQNILRDLHSVVVAYSGGVDSSLLLQIAHDCLGERAAGVTIVSPSQPAHERQQAQIIARRIGARCVLLPGREMQDPRYRANTPERCYICKGHICDQLLAFAQNEGYFHVVDGSNADDLGDYRPGLQAARERGVRSPLQEAHLNKAEIRQLACQLGLPNWNQPAAACLASRLPYGLPISAQLLAQIEGAEAALRALGLGQLRVRHHESIARIELEPADFAAALAQQSAIVGALTALGYSYVTLDLAGFRSGSMNKGIDADGREKT